MINRAETGSHLLGHDSLTPAQGAQAVAHKQQLLAEQLGRGVGANCGHHASAAAHRPVLLGEEGDHA